MQTYSVLETCFGNKLTLRPVSNGEGLSKGDAENLYDALPHAHCIVSDHEAQAVIEKFKQENN